MYERVSQWPELWDDKEIFSTYRDEVNDRETHEAKRREHEIMHNVRIAARNPRYAFEQMEKDSTSSVPTSSASALTEDVEIPEDLTEYPDNPDTAEATIEEVAEIVESSDDDEDEDDEDEDDGEIDDDEDEEGHGADDVRIGDEEGAWEEDEDEDDALLPTARAVSEGPTPFGGLYNV